jgi:hypothetical protein
VRATLCALLVASLLPCALAAQETRGNISGTVRDPVGVVPGATVKIANVDTKVSQTLVTNGSGYYEAPLLTPGTYDVSVQLPGFKSASRSGVVLGVAAQVNVSFTLEVGAVTEEVNVTAEAPLLDTNSVSSGANFDRRLVDALPMFSNMPIMLARFSSGVNPNDAQPQVSQGNVDNTNLAAGTALGNVGSNTYTIDGANNNGTSRRIAISPNSDSIEEMRVESSNFDAAVGHGTGLRTPRAARSTTSIGRTSSTRSPLSRRPRSTTSARASSARDTHTTSRSRTAAPSASQAWWTGAGSCSTSSTTRT